MWLLICPSSGVSVPALSIERRRTAKAFSFRLGFGDVVPGGMGFDA
jgi:hypothetical protein